MPHAAKRAQKLAVSLIAGIALLISVSLDASSQTAVDAGKLFEQAQQFQQQGRLADAERLYKRSLEIAERTLGPFHQNVLMLHQVLGGLYQTQGRYTDTELSYNRAVVVAQTLRGETHPEFGQTLLDLGSVYFAQGRLRDAEVVIQRSLEVLEKALGPIHSQVGRARNNLAAVYAGQGRYASAETFYKQALDIREKTLGPSHKDTAGSLSNLAALYKDLGRYAEAEPLFKRSLEIREKTLGTSSALFAASLNNLAILYGHQGRNAEVESLHKRALAIREKALGPVHPDVAASLQNLAHILKHQHRHAEAEALLKRSLSIYEKTVGAQSPRAAAALSDLALLYRAQNRYADAEPLHKKALEIRTATLGPSHPTTADSLGNLASLYGAQGRYTDAEPLFLRALEIRETTLGANHPLVALSLNNLALLYSAEYRLKEALAIIRRTVEEQTAVAPMSYVILDESRKSALLDDEQSFSASYRVLQSTSSSAAAGAVARVAQRFAGGSDQLAELVRREQDLGSEIDRLENEIISALSRASDQRDQAAEARNRERRLALGIERKRTVDALAEKYPNYVALSKPLPLTLKETQQLLADDEALVAFDILEPASYVWVITKDTASWQELPIAAKSLDAAVDQLRRAVVVNDKPFDAALAHKLYQQTLGPVAEKLAKKKRLSIVANGALTSIPFSLLVTANPAGKRLSEVDWLIKSHAITVIPSIFSLKAMRSASRKSTAPNEMVAFADPVFSAKDRAKARLERISMRSLPSYYEGSQLNIQKLGEALRPLPGSRVEVQAIGRALGVASSDLKMGLDATETAVKQAPLDSYRIVYFATHGLVSGELAQFGKAKAEPALALTIPDNPSEADDGILQASEVARLRLNAEWAVLSACNTASSDGVSAEALSGLARAFLYAGARSLIVSHWDVEDSVTARLMISLFTIKKRKPSVSHGEALQEAILTILASNKDESDAHPRLWAPFIVVGEPAKVFPR